MLMPAVEVDERRLRAGIVAVQRWKTMLLHSNSHAHRVEVGGCGLGDAPGLRAELLLRHAVAEVALSFGNAAALTSAPSNSTTGR